MIRLQTPPPTARHPEPRGAVESAVETTTVRIGTALLELIDRSGPPPFFSTRGLYGRLMRWSLQDPEFKTQLFRFIDVFPALRTRAEIERHFREYLGPYLSHAPPALRLGFQALVGSPRLLERALRRNISGVARLFIIEDRPALVRDAVRRLHRSRRAFTLDFLGETVVSEREADHYASHCLKYLDLLGKDEALEEVRIGNSHGVGPPLNTSIKLSALDSQIHPADPETAIVRLKGRLVPILRRARSFHAFVNLDMEHYALKDLTLRLYRSVLREPEFRGWTGLGIAIQAYLRESYKDLTDLIAWARAHRQPITVRLVKGAYWDYETVIAQQRGWPIPVFSRKEETDAAFERLSLLLLDNLDYVTPAFGSHNVRSLAHAITQAAARGIDHDRYEVQVLRGMAEPLETALIRLGCRVRQYCPVGDLIPGMAYLVRRLLENSSNEGFLVARFARRESAERLLANPAKLVTTPSIHRSREPTVSGTSTFRNFPHLDFTQSANRHSFRRALAMERRRLGKTWPLVIHGKPVQKGDSFPSINPAHPSQIVGEVALAGVNDAEAAVDAARSAAPVWSRWSPEKRAAAIERAASLLEANRLELAALEVIEAGKPWVEADADVSEAIDFCRFYAAEARRLGKPELTQRIPGEENVHHWLPRGVAAVIAPWNFPLAILCGMTAAALVTGNTVIMKPAEQTPVIGARLMQIFVQAGIPAGALNLLNGFGDVGAHLVRHPDVDLILFTGSKEVGLDIWKAAGETRPGQRSLKRAICEMGGKNAMIVDADADLDEAIPAILYSAFGYQGQKCSALSRLIVLEEIHDQLLDRLTAAASDLRIGDPAEPGVFLGPLIDADARDKCQRYFEMGMTEATLVHSGKPPDGSGYYFAPAIFDDVPPSARIAREEIFGPVLSVLRAGNLEEAIHVANDHEFALTGGIFSRSPGNIKRARNLVAAGNFYINRTITGAIVERQPFGGFRMSGGGTKAGGRDYLTECMVPRVVSENRLRHGFAPLEDL